MIYKLIVLHSVVIFCLGRNQKEIQSIDQISESDTYYQFNMYTQFNTLEQSNMGPNNVSISRILLVGSEDVAFDYTHTFHQEYIQIQITIQSANRHVFEIQQTYDEYSGNWYFLTFRYRPYDQSTIIQLFHTSNSRELIFQQVYSHELKFNTWEVGNLNDHQYPGIVRYQKEYLQTEDFINFNLFSVESIQQNNNQINQHFNQIQQLLFNFCYEECKICKGLICIPCYHLNNCNQTQPLQIHHINHFSQGINIHIDNLTINDKVIHNQTILSLSNIVIPVNLSINNFLINKCNFNGTILFDISEEVNLNINGLTIQQTFMSNVHQFMKLPQETKIKGLVIKQSAANEIGLMSFQRNIILEDILLDGFFFAGHTFLDGAQQEDDESFYKQEPKLRHVFIKNFIIKNITQLQSVLLNLYQTRGVRLNVEIDNFQILYNHNVDRGLIFYISVHNLTINNFLIHADRNCRYFELHRTQYLTIQNGLINGKLNHINQVNTLIQAMDSQRYYIKNITIQDVYVSEKQGLIHINEGVDYRTNFIIIEDITIINVGIYDQQAPLIQIIQSLQDSGNIKLKNINIKQVLIDRTFSIQSAILQVQALSWKTLLNNITLENIKFQKDQLSSIYVDVNYLEIQDSNFINIGNLFESNNSAKGGLGHFKVQNLTIINSTFKQCQGASGGAFYLETQRNSNVILKNNAFIENSANLGQLIKDSQGGSIFIDSQYSDKLQLFIQDIDVFQSYSYYQGGFIYINPSNKENHIQVENVQVRDIYSQQSSFIHSLTDKQSNVIIKNVTIINPLDFYNTYVNLLKYQVLPQNTGIFTIQAQSIRLENLKFTGYGLQGIMSISVTQQLSLNKIDIYGSFFKDIQLALIQVPEIVENINQIQINRFSITKCSLEKQEQSIKRLLSQNEEELGFIKINLQSQNTNIVISELLLSNNICIDCQSGFVNLQNNNSESKLQIGSSIIQENQCDYNFIMIKGIIKTVITQTIFSGNSISKFSLLSIKKSPILIKNTQFLFNEVQSFEVDSLQFRLQDCVIIQPQTNAPLNSYKINGRQLRMAQLDLINKTEELEIQEINHKNNATLLKLAYYDHLFKTDTQQDQQQLQDFTKIDPYHIYGTQEKQKFLLLPSNNLYPQQYYDPFKEQYYSYDLNYTIFALDLYGEMAQISDKHTLNVTTQLFDVNQSMVIKKFDQQKVIYDPQARGFKMQNIKIQFNPYHQPQLCLQLLVQCDCIQNNYTHYINIRTFKCIIGEYLYNDQCKTCDVSINQYQIKPDQNICLVADDNILEQFELNRVKLRQGYWRDSIQSSQYLYCQNNVDSCQGGWQVADKSCSVGYLGPLCEECDSQDLSGNGYYQKQNSIGNCVKCGNQIFWFVKTISMIIWILISTLVTVNNIQIQTLQYLQYFLSYKQFDILYRLNQNQTNTVIKIFINFVQIIQMIDYLQIQNLKQFYNPLEFISNPVSSSSYNLDCLLFQKEIDVEPQYMKLIIFIVIPLILILIFNMVHLVYRYYIQKKENNEDQPIIAYKSNYQSILYTSILYLLFYLQPDIIKQLTYFVSFRKISDNIYVKGYLLMTFFSRQHLLWMSTFIIPALCIFTMTFPMIVFYSLYKIKNKLFYKQNRYKFSYMFNEYRQNSYFWEIYKILQREIIITIVILLSQEYTLIKIWILFAILSLYQQVLKRFNPYNQGKLNRFEGKCIEIVLIIFFTLTLLQTTGSNQHTIIYIIQILFFIEIGVLLLFNVFKLIQSYKGLLIDKFINFYKMIVMRYPRIDYSLPQISNWMKVREQYKGRLNNLSRQLKGYLKERGRQASYLKAGTETYSQKNVNTTFADRNLNEFPMNRLQTLVDLTIINNTQIQDLQQS
ncbi:hypothetical protein pb186bvf_010113 [Paramecium bursaria]